MVPQDRHWNGYEIPSETLAKFKGILERDLGNPFPWTDDEIKKMANSVLHLLDVLIPEPPKEKPDDRGRDSNLSVG